VSGLVYECEINFLSIERAAKLVPPEYIEAWSWFIENQGQHIPALPMGKYKPEGMKLPLARQAGIYCPSYENLPSKGAGKESYVLSVHSEGQSIYPDHEKLDRPDGTWILDYHEQQGLDRSQDYNRKLLRCMEDGIPVGVMVRSRKGKGYTVLGLAFVEQYNSATHMFTFHGPVNKETVADGLYATFSLADVKPDELSALKDSDGADERKRAVAERVVRERQDKFRKALLDAYGNACAITDIDVPQVLQAAHIDPYRGRKSQIASNGILLRADLHLLYDSDLISIEPGTHRVCTSARLRQTPYARFSRAEIREPEDTRLRPDDELLELHYKEFLVAETGAA
jgi:putative restriction endonuclease